jgi:hypothetical protein
MRAIGLTLFLLTLVVPATDTRAASKRECKAACAQQILAC